MRARTYVWIIGIVLVCGSVASLLRTVDNSLFKTSQRAGANPQAVNNSPKSGPPSPTVVRDQHSKAGGLLAEASVYAAQALNHTATWQREIEPLIENTRGENIAASEELVKQLAHVMREQRPTADDLQATSKRIGVLREKLEGLTTQAEAEPFTALEMAEIRELHSRAKTSSSVWSAAVERARAIEREARRKTFPVAQPTLPEKIEAANDEETLANLNADIEQDKQQAAKEREREIQRAADKVEASEEKKALLEKALSSEVKGALAPFLESRTVQPRLSGASVLFGKTFEKQPMSLGKIEGIGALNESVSGLKRLALIGGNRKLPEPRWSVSSQPGNWREGDEEMLKRAQQMLRLYGAILVEEGLLSP